MRPVAYPAATLAAFLRTATVATLPELAAALGHPSAATVRRKLRELACLSSYSHSRAYYALPECARFDRLGLWSCRGIRFSAHGTLAATARALVEGSAAGYRVAELDELLGVRTQVVLSQLAREGRLQRLRVGGQSVYCAADPAARRAQRTARSAALADPAARPPVPVPAALDAATGTALGRLCGVLNEKQRRLAAGWLAQLAGRGGDRRVAQLTGLNIKTVRKGRHELAAGRIDRTRVRQPGGGRKPLVKKSRA